MLTRKSLITKWILYAFVLVLFSALQQLVLDQIRLLGVVPFLLPMVVAIVAAVEGPTGGAVFGLAVGVLADLTGSGVFPGVYTLGFACAALAVAVISKYWVMRSLFGAVIYALLSFAALDALQFLYLFFVQGARPEVVASLAGREAAISLVFVIPIYLAYTRVYRVFDAEL